MCKVAVWSVVALLSVAEAQTALAGGTLAVLPDQVTVESQATLHVIYTVGPEGFRPGDQLRVHDPLLHGIRMTKYSTPVVRPEDCGPSTNLVSVTTDGDGTVQLERNTESQDSHEPAWTDAWLDTGELYQGDQIVITYGDISSGADCAFTAAPRSFHHLRWLAEEAVGGAADLAHVGNVPHIDFIARRASHVAATGPSVVQQGSLVEINVAMLDNLGNPDFAWEGEVAVSLGRSASVRTLDANDRGRTTFSVVLTELGTERFDVTATPVGGDALHTTTNPIVVREDPSEFVYWGDIHSHHGNTYVDDDGLYVDENHEYARYYANIDVGCESAKSPYTFDEPYEIDHFDLWADLQDTCAALSQSGSYVALLGFEWMNTGVIGNHHNVYYDGCDGPPGEQALADLDELYEYLDDAAEEGHRAVAIPHASYAGWDWDRQRDDLRAAAEIYSGGWGNSLEGELDTIEGSTRDAMRHGLKLGFIASSDNHSGHLGNPLLEPGRFGYEGLVAFVAPDLNHHTIFSALKDRRTYATTGARIVLDFAVEDGVAELGMGQAFVADRPVFRWEVSGTGPLERVMVRAIRSDDHQAVDFVLHSASVKTADTAGSFEWTDYDGEAYAVWLQIEEPEHSAWSSPIYLSRCEPDAVDPNGYCNGDEGDSGAVPSGGAWDADGSGDCGAHRDGGCDTSAGRSAGAGVMWVSLIALARRRSGL